MLETDLKRQTNTGMKQEDRCSLVLNVNLELPLLSRKGPDRIARGGTCTIHTVAVCTSLRNMLVHTVQL